MNGPKIYAELSSTARRFINSYKPIEKTKVTKEYKYLSVGANLPAAKPAQETDQIHKYLSPYATASEVEKDFGKHIDTIA